MKDTEPALTKRASFARLAPDIGRPMVTGPERDTTWRDLIAESIRPVISIVPQSSTTIGIIRIVY